MMSMWFILCCACIVVVQSLSHAWVPLPMGFSRQECPRGLLFPSPGDLPNPGIELASLASLALAGRFFSTEPSGKSVCITVHSSSFKNFLKLFFIQFWNVTSHLQIFKNIGSIPRVVQCIFEPVDTQYFVPSISVDLTEFLEWCRHCLKYITCII